MDAADSSARHRNSSSRINLAAARRWVDVVLYGLTGGVVYWFAEPLVSVVTDPILVRIEEMGARLAAGVLIGLGIGIIFWQARHRLSRLKKDLWGHLLISFRYPPIYISVLIGMVMHAAFAQQGISLRELIALLVQAPSLLAFGIGALIATSCHLLTESNVGTNESVSRKRRPLPDPGEGHAWRPLNDSEYSSLLDWVASDEPATEDGFGFATPIAERITNCLSAPWNGASPSIALVGQQGSGKSTIACLVEGSLGDRRDARDIVFVRISVWGYESAAAASTGTLSAIVKAIGGRVSTLSMLGMPEQYVAAVREASGSLGSLLRIVEGAPGPDAVLDTIEQVLAATRLRLVVWLEDLERFGTEGTAYDKHVSSTDEKLAPLRALLYKLDSLQHAVVITADASLRSRFDRDKIARYVELVPQLCMTDAGRYVATVRQACISLGPEWIDPDPKWRGSTSLPTGLGSYGSWAYVHGERLDTSWIGAIGQLLSTPRVLKRWIRDVHRSWGVLRGEVDLDELLMLSCIRVVSPDYFAWVVDRDAQLCITKPEHGLDKEYEKRRTRLNEELRAIESNSGKPTHARYVTTLIKALYPQSGINEEAYFVHAPRQLQGVASGAPLDYLRRVVSQAPVQEADSDQQALRAWEQWNSGVRDEIPRRLCDSKRAGRTARFSSVNTIRSPEIALQLVCEEAAKTSALDWPADPNDILSYKHDHIGIGAMRTVLEGQRLEAELLCECLLDLVNTYAKRHLPIVAQLASEFVANDDGRMRRSLLRPEQRERINKQVQVQLSLNYRTRGSGNQLLEAMQHGSPWIPLWLSYTLERLRAERNGPKPNGLPFDEWPKFVQGLCGAVVHDGQRGIPLIVPFVVSQGDPSTRPSFDEKSAQFLFGDAWSDIADVVRQTPLPDEDPYGIGPRWKGLKQALEP